MQKKLIIDDKLLQITINRLCQQLIENHFDFADSVLIGLQPRGIYLAKHIQNSLLELAHIKATVGILDTTFHRDDFRRRDKPVKAHKTDIPFVIEDKKVILIDDVLFTGRTVRSALDAMITFGRPRNVELLVLINRKFQRELPVEPDYVGKNVHTLETQKVLVELTDQGHSKNSIWLIDK